MGLLSIRLKTFPLLLVPFLFIIVLQLVKLLEKLVIFDHVFLNVVLESFTLLLCSLLHSIFIDVEETISIKLLEYSKEP